MKVKLQEIADAIEMHSDEFFCYYRRDTGEIITLSDEDFSAAEEDEPLEDYPEWQRENIKIAKEILEDTENRYILLPGKFEFHEWKVMREFAFQLKDPEQSKTLYRAIHGRGAFRRFKTLIYEFGVAEEWFKYRTNALLELARLWCEEHGIEYEE